MNTQSLANSAFFLLGIVCVLLSVRAFYVYTLSRSNMLFIIGVAMASIALAIFCGFVGDVHLVPYNTKWGWYAGTTTGAFALVWSSLAKSNEQLRSIKNWQILITILFIVIVVLTPFLPFFPNPFVPATLNIFRSMIYIVGFMRYVALYNSKRTRFTLLMFLSFLFVGVGFGTLTPQIFQPNLAVFVIVASSLRIIGYSTLLTAYSIG